MNKQIKSLLVVVTILLTSLSQAMATTDISKKVEVKSNTEIVNTLNKKAKKLVKKNKESLNMYLAVMDLYAHQPQAFYNLDQTTQNKFNIAVENLNNELSSSRKKEVRELASQIGFNQGVSEFIWNLKKSYSVILPVIDITKEIEKASI